MKILMFLLKKTRQDVYQNNVTCKKIKSNLEIKRVTHCAFSLGPGGAERQLCVTAKGLSSYKNIKQNVLCFSLGNGYERHYLEYLTSLCIPVFDILEKKPSGKLTRIIKKRLFFFGNKFTETVSAFTEYFILQKSDIAHIWSCNIHALLGAYLAGVPRIIFAGRNVSPEELYKAQNKYHIKNRFKCFLLRLLLKTICYESSIFFINNSHAGKKSYLKWLSANKLNIDVIHNGVLLEQPGGQNKSLEFTGKAGLNIISDSYLISGCMRFSPEKNISLWLDTAVILATKYEVYSILIGDGPLLEYSKETINKLRLSDKIIILGKKYNPEAYIKVSDLFLLTSKAEGLPNVLLESQGLGVPVVTTRAGGAPEAVIDGASGVVVDLNISAKKLSETIYSTLINTTWRAEAGKLGVKNMKNNFNCRKMIKKTLQTYGINIK